MRIGMRHQFVGLLGRGIEADRMVDGISFRERDLGIAAIDGATRRVGQMFDAMMSRALENVQEGGEIRFAVDLRVLDRIPHACLRGEMDDPLGAFSLEEMEGLLRVSEVELMMLVIR